MSTSYTTAIEQLYVAYFNRPADAAGLAYWTKVLQTQNGNTSAVSAAFAGSAEYINSFAGMSPEQVVGQIYQNLFGRAAETSGLNFWAGHLGSGALKIDLIVKNIADGAQGTDKTIFDNKVMAAAAFTAALDTDSEIDAFVHPQVAQAAKEFIASIRHDASRVQALVPATLAKTMDKMFRTGEIQMLGTGTDRLEGTLTNDSFSGWIVDNTASLQSGDVVRGGQGTRDLLFAELGNGNKEAVKPMLQVELVRVNAVPQGSTNGSAAVPGVVRLDADASSGVREWESLRSWADLVIENVHLAPMASLREHTVTMRDSSGGDVDFGVYFTPAALSDARTRDGGKLDVSIILDYAGSVATGGDLVVGSMAEGGFSAGIERFFIEVRDSSALQTINSTNNALREVIIVNGLTTEHRAGPANEGDLTVLGATAPAVPGSVTEALPRSEGQHNSFGFSDVRVIDASAMSGDIGFDAEITAAALLKYSMAGPEYEQHFHYRGGAGNDSIHVTIDGAVLASASEGFSGRQPGNYVLTVNGGAGNDDLRLTVTDGLPGWAALQKFNHNVNLYAGAGDDTVRLASAGAVRIWLGTGKDTLVLEAGWNGLAIMSEFSVDGDRIDLSALGGRGDAFSGSAIANGHQSITVQAASAANDTLAEIAAMYSDDVAASNHVFVSYDSNNVGSVYTVLDPAGGAIEVTLVGSIILSTAGWGALGAANFA